MHLVFDIAAVALAHVAHHLGKHIFQRVVAHLAAMLARCLNGLIAVVANVEGGAVEVAAVLRCIAVFLAQGSHILLRPHDARYDDFMQWNALHLQTVVKVAADVLQQNGSAGHEIGNAVAQAVDIEIGIGTHIDEQLLAL